jgi:RND family efflux transporter MFP subunit
MQHRNLFAVTLALLLATAGARGQVPDATVETATVTLEETSSVISLPGTVISTRDAEIAAEISGRLTWVARVGDQVEAGEPLAHIDDHLLRLQLRNDEAEIARLEADIQYHRRQIARLQRLAVTNNMAQSELDEVESRLQMRLQEQRIAEVSRDRTLYDLSRAHVTAPFNGVVAARSMAPGEYTGRGDALVRLVDTTDLEISVNAPLRVARYNAVGSTAQVQTDGEVASTTIRGMVPVGDERSRMMELRLVTQSDHWLIGEAVTVMLPDGERRSALSVPRDALVLRDREVYVYSVSEEGTAMKVPVRTLAGHGERIAVEGALHAGDEVVVRGAERLREGQPLKIVQAALAAR